MKHAFVALSCNPAEPETPSIEDSVYLDEDPVYLAEITATGLVMGYADEVSDMSELEHNLFSLAYALLLQHDYSASLDVIQLLPALSGLRQVVVQ